MSCLSRFNARMDKWFRDLFCEDWEGLDWSS
jgi:hypothetical protein